MADKRDIEFRRQNSLFTREAYDYYRQYRHHCVKGIDQYNYYLKSIEGIFRIIEQMMIESEGGIYIEGLGYFCFLKSKNKFKLRGNIKVNKYIKKREKHKYYPYLFLESPFEGWTMSGTFKTAICAPSGENKKLHFDLCESYTQAKKQSNRENR